MSQFKYKAVDQEGKIISGEISAINEVDLEAKLTNFKLDIISTKEVKKGTSSLFAKKITEKDMIILCTQLEQLEKAGVPLLDTLEDMIESADNPRMTMILRDVYESVKSGNMLSKSFANHPYVFDEVFTGLIAAGEASGQLGEIFEQLTHHFKWVQEIKSKIKKASAYPIFVCLVMSAVIFIMMIYVVPKMVDFLTSQDMDLPGYTTALIATSEFFQKKWMLIITLPVIAYIVSKIMYRTNDAYHYFIDQLKLKIPVIGNAFRKIELSRFCRFFSITYKSGIPLLECLDISLKVVKNVIIKDSVVRVRVSVSEGQSLTNALKMTGNFPNLVIRMIKIGEETGKIDNSLNNINFFYDKEVNDSVNAIIAVIQPTLTIVLGMIMGWIAMAVFGPLYGSFSKLVI